MKLLLNLSLSAILMSCYSVSAMHNYGNYFDLLRTGSREFLFLLPDTFGSNIGWLNGCVYSLLANDRCRAYFSLCDCALGFALSGVLSEVAFSLSNDICAHFYDSTESDAPIQVAVSSVIASVFFIRTIISYMKRDLYGIDPFSLSYFIEELFQIRMSSARGTKRAEIQRDFLINPFVRTVKKKLLYNSEYPSIHKKLLDTIISDDIYDYLEKKKNIIPGDRLLKKIAVNDAVFKSSLFKGKKRYYNSCGVPVSFGYGGIPQELIAHVLQYVGSLSCKSPTLLMKRTS